MENHVLDHDILNNYFSRIGAFDQYPTILNPIEDTSYCGYLYINGSEEVQRHIKLLEDSVYGEISKYIYYIINSNKLSKIDFIPLLDFKFRLDKLLTSEIRLITLKDWFSCSQGGMIDTRLDIEVINRIESQSRSCLFFWECISIQLDSAKRTKLYIEDVVQNLNSLLEERLAKTNPLDYSFEVRPEVDYNLYQDITTLLHRLLIQESILPENSTLSNFRSVFFHQDRRYNKELVLTTMIWNSNSYNTLSYFIKLLQEWLIVNPKRGSKRSNYKIAVSRFVKLDGKPFEKNKYRHDADPNEDVKLRIHQVFAETIECYKDRFLTTPIGVQTKLVDSVPRKLLQIIRLM